MTVEMPEYNKEVARNFIRKIEDEILPELERIREELESDESNWAEDEAWEGTTDQEHAQTLIGFMQDAEQYLTDGARALTDAIED